MPAGRATHHADLFRINLVSGAVGAHPAHRGFRVVNGRWKLVLRGEPVGDCRRDEAALRKLDAETIVPLAGAGPKTAAMDAQHSGEWPVARLGAGKIELQVLVVGIRILDVGLPNDSFGDLGGGGQAARPTGTQKPAHA